MGGLLPSAPKSAMSIQSADTRVADRRPADPRPADPLDPMRGAWVDRGRLIAGLVLCLILVFAATFALYRGSVPPHDGAGRLLGADFSALWAAGKAGLGGDWASSYSFPAFMAHMRSLYGESALGLLWAYPPLFYFVVMPLAALPYSAALALWLSATFAGLAIAVRRILSGHGPLVWLAIVAFPGVFGNAIHGQTGFLTAGLFAGALLALRGGRFWRGCFSPVSLTSRNTVC